MNIVPPFCKGHEAPRFDESILFTYVYYLSG